MTEPVQEAPKAEVKAEPAVPQIDIEGKIKEAVDASRKDLAKEINEAASKQVKESLKKLVNDEPEKDKVHPTLRKLATDPDGFVAELTADKTEIARQVRAEMMEERQAEKVYEKFVEEYPELADHADYIEVAASKEIRNGKSFKDAVTEGCKQVVGKLKLQSVTASARSKFARDAAIPSGGNSSGGEASKRPAGAQGFIQQQREAAKKLRNRSR